jgi:hypothetical protein
MSAYLLIAGKTGGDAEEMREDSHFEAHAEILQEGAIGLAEVSLFLQVNPILSRWGVLLNLFPGEIPVGTRMVWLLQLPAHGIRPRRCQRQLCISTLHHLRHAPVSPRH